MRPRESEIAYFLRTIFLGFSQITPLNLQKTYCETDKTKETMLRYFTLVAAMMCATMMWAQDVDSCQDTRTEEELRQDLWEFGEKSRAHMMQKDEVYDSLITEREKKLLSYAKKIIKGNENRVCIPKEINTILGYNDTVNFYATPQWDSVYYEPDREYITSMTVPIKFDTDKGPIASKMSVVVDMVRYEHIVSSNFTLSNDSITKHLMVSYNIYGDLVAIHVFNDDMTLENSYVTKDEPNYRKKMMAEAKTSKKSKSSSKRNNYRYSQSGSNNILYRDDRGKNKYRENYRRQYHGYGYREGETQRLNGKEVKMPYY